MTGISVGAALGEGFGLIRRRPISVLAWGAAVVGLQMATYALFATYYLTFYGGALDTLAHRGDWLQWLQSLSTPEVRRTQNLLQLFNLIQLFVMSIIYCAAFRAVLHPDRSSFAYLRIGAPEFFMVILLIAGVIAFVIGVVVLAIPLAIVAAIAAPVARAAGAAFGLVLVLLVMLGMALAAIYFAVRFALVGPMMVQDGRFHLFESWTLTRGRVGSVVLIGLGLFGFYLLADLVLLALLLLLSAAAVQSVGGLGAAAAVLHQSPQAFAARAWPVLAAYGLIHVPIAGAVVAIAGAPWARVYRDLLPDASHIFA